MISKNRYQSIFETTLDGIIVIDSRGKIVDINSAGLVLFQYQKEDLLDKNVHVLMPEPDKSKHDGYIQAYQKTGRPQIIGIGRQVEGLKRNGEVFPFRLAVSEFEMDGKQYFTGIVHDLTKNIMQERIIRGYAHELEERVEKRTSELSEEIELRKTAQNALLETQVLYETISKNYPNGTISVIDAEMNTVFVEGAELRTIGKSAEQLIGKSYLDNIPPTWRTKVEENIRAVFFDDERNFEYGDERMYRVRCVPLSSNEGKVAQVLVVENNITTEKRAEKEIYTALNKARELNEMKTNFVSMASHEFRTPLTSILSSVAIISKYTESTQQENRLKHLQKIRENVQNLTLILNDFLSLERLEGGYVKYHPTEVDIHELIVGVVEDAEPMQKTEQGIEVEIGDSISQWNVDQFLLRNVLTNLIGNALKYSKKDVLVRANQEGDALQIDVVDQGIGISDEDQKNLFERFYRATNAGQVQGTGLGLNIVKRYAEIMNAEITFESKINEGSTFTIRLDGKK